MLDFIIYGTICVVLGSLIINFVLPALLVMIAVFIDWCCR